MSEANNITFAQAKTSFFYRPKVKRKYNTLHLAGKEVCKKDEENLVLFELNINLLYRRYAKAVLFFNNIVVFNQPENIVEQSSPPSVASAIMASYRQSAKSRCISGVG